MRALALPPAEERRPGTALDSNRHRRGRPGRFGPLHRVWNVPEKGSACQSPLSLVFNSPGWKFMSLVDR